VASVECEHYGSRMDRITVQQAVPRSHTCTWPVDVSENTLPLGDGNDSM